MQKRLSIRRLLKILLPVLIVAQVAFVWSGVVSLREAIVIVLVLEILFFSVVATQIAFAARRYRHNRSLGEDVWSSVEEGFEVLLPRSLAKWVVMEPQLFTYLVRWVFRKTQLRENEFSYHEQLHLGAIVGMILFTTPVEILILELVIPWSWLRWTLLLLSVYALLWVCGFCASFVLRPHALEEKGLKIRYGAFVETVLPYSNLASVRRRHWTSLELGDGLRVSSQEGVAYIVAGSRTNVELTLHSPVTVRGMFRSTRPVSTVYIAADKPEDLVQELKTRTEVQKQDFCEATD